MPRTLLAGCLALFGAGVQLHEAVATTGGWAMTVVAAVLIARSPTLRAELRAWWPLGAFLACALVLPLVGGHAPTGSGVARTFDVLFVLSACVATRVVSDGALRRVAIVVGSVTALSCLTAGLQYFGRWPPAEAFAPYTWLSIPFDRVYEPVQGATHRFMAGGLLFHRLRFANVTSVLVVLFAAAALRHKRVGPSAFVAALGFVAVAIFPQARAATVALVVGVLTVSFFGSARKALGALVGVGVIVVAATLVLAVPSWRERFTSGFDPSSSIDRTFLRGAGVAALKTAPLTGIGLGQFKPREWLAPDAPPGLDGHQGKSHNQFLTLAAEAGLPTALVFLAFLGLLAAWAAKALPAAAGALGALALFLALSVLHDPLFHAEASMALFGGLGAALGLARRDPA